MLQLIENTILTALKEKFTQSEVDSFPVNFDDYNPDDVNSDDDY